MDGTIEGDWYWVNEGDHYWFPAKRVLGAAGGWTNDDTWEDFTGSVLAWVRIPTPKEIDE